MTATLEAPTAPPRTRDQRMVALAHANEVRVARAALKQQLRTGAMHIADVFTDPPACAATARVLVLLRAVPGVGETKARRALKAHHVSESKTVAGLSGRQRAALAAHFRG